MIRTFGKVALLTSALISSQVCLAEQVYWTFPPSSGQGVLVNNTGMISLFVSSVVPTSPNPAGTAWIPCRSNVIRFDRKLDGSAVPQLIVNQLLANLLFAQANNSSIRTRISRNSNNDCFGSEVFQTK